MSLKNPETRPQIVRAHYHRVEIQEHQGNPLIRALPSLADVTELIPTFGHYPEIGKGLSTWGRLQKIDLLDQDYLDPLPNHFEVIQQLFLCIYSGYSFRNLASIEYRKTLVSFLRSYRQGVLKPLGPWQPTSRPVFSLFGCSGVGKSLVTERTLSYFPKAIYHPRYKTVQVVWIKVDCPPDGSLKQFLLSIIREFDSILGSSYLDDYGGLAKDGLIQAIAFLAAFHHLGVLVIDEIQHLLDARAKDMAVLLNYLVTFVNTVHVPIANIGTIRAMEMCELALKQARRAGIPIVWDRIKKEDAQWRQFLEGLWEYQWCEPVELSERLSEIMYFYTQGIHALVVRLFQLVQKEALLNNTKISTVIIERVATEKFILVEPMLVSLRLNTKSPRDFWATKDAKIYEDLIYKTLRGHQSGIPPSAPPQVTISNNSEIRRALAALQKMGYDRESCKSTVQNFFDDNPSLDANRAVSQFLSIEEDTTSETDSSHKTLEQIAEQAKVSGRTPLQAFQEAGLSPKSRKKS